MHWSQIASISIKLSVNVMSSLIKVMAYIKNPMIFNMKVDRFGLLQSFLFFETTFSNILLIPWFETSTSRKS